jgi:hypothetical protein
MGGVILKAFEEERKGGEFDLKARMILHILAEHGVTMTDQEYKKYVPKFLIMDQKSIDKFLDDDQENLNVA